MSFRTIVMVSLLLGPALVFAQATPPAGRANPASAPAPTGSATPVSPASAKPNPAAAPVAPRSDAGASERGLAPVRPGEPGVTPHVEHAVSHGVDAQGHTLDPHGKPVGQAPAPASTAR